jgi:hypothetical protein
MRADHHMLHSDLKFARVSSWQAYVLCWITSEPAGADNGGKYYLADDLANPTNPPIIMGSRAKFLRQYFKFVRRGAQRIEATSNNSTFDPVAFRNTDGKQVVVVKASGGGSFNVLGLPAGNYGIKYTTASQYDVDAAPVTISSGQLVVTNIPAAGVITVYGR